MLSKTPSLLHQNLVRALTDAFTEQKSYRIVAVAIEGYQNPDKVGRHEPDILAKDSFDNWQIGEAKTGEDLNDQAKEQFLDFSNYSFHVIVPASKKKELDEFLKELGINGKVTIWTV